MLADGGPPPRKLTSPNCFCCGKNSIISVPGYCVYEQPVIGLGGQAYMVTYLSFYCLTCNAFNAGTIPVHTARAFLMEGAAHIYLTQNDPAPVGRRPVKHAPQQNPITDDEFLDFMGSLDKTPIEEVWAELEGSA